MALVLMAAMELLVRMTIIVYGLRLTVTLIASVVLQLIDQQVQVIAQIKLQLMKLKLKKNLSSES